MPSAPIYPHGLKPPRIERNAGPTALAATISADLAKRVRFDAEQVLTGTERQQARDNIQAAAAADLTALSTAIGNPDFDFAATYQTAAA